MERYRKKDMLQTVDTLLRANDAVSKTAASNPQGASEALMQCQESAIMLGNAIETYGEKYTPLVQILEDYCENLYQMNESLLEENLRRKMAKKIQKQLTTLQNGIKYELPEDKKEVVFLPYKASMWDSLESVWKAADKDPECDAYVIPIPYFDKNPDGSFKEEHYEGDQYPQNVPITRYDEYDLEERHPDVIYIHNPYDECNHVTSVHPYFYSKNLKNFTDRLVYIPYFILGEIAPDDQRAVDGMKHFCFVPGTIYADRVIVQSENMRQIYMNEYIKAAKEMGLSGEHVDRRFLEKKFLGTGSPKIDKVLNTREEDLEIPAEWLKVIEKPDGSRKKIVFYNTSVSALLQHSEKMLRKMESVFEIFKANQEEVALLWRPHPLIRATVESMRPQLWLEYDKLVKKYRSEEWGIYDDSADLDRAVVLSDAYYGDQSSVAQLCRKAQVPVMIQDIEVFDMHHYIPQFIFSQKIESCLWFLPGNYKGIFSVDILTGKATLETEMVPRDESLGEKYLWGPMQRCGEYFICAPVNAKHILALNIEKKKQIFIDDSEILDYLKGGAKYSAQIMEENHIYLMPACARGILKVEVQQKKGFLYMDILKQYKAFFGEEYAYLSTGAWHRYNEEIYMALYEKPYLMRINLHRKELEFIKVSETSNGFQTAAGSGGYIYIISRDGRILQWNIEQRKVENEQKAVVENSILGQFVRSFLYDNYICFVSGEQNICLRIKQDDLTVLCDKFEKIWDIPGMEDKQVHFTYFDKMGNIFFVSEKELMTVNLKSKSIECKEIIYPVTEILRYFEEESQKCDIYYENDYYRGLKEFLRDVI